MSVPSTCTEAVRRLWEYVDGDLDDADRHDVEQHLQWCMRCCGEVEFARRLRQRLAGRPRELPADVGARLEDFLDGLDTVPGSGP